MKPEDFNIKNIIPKMPKDFELPPNPTFKVIEELQEVKQELRNMKALLTLIGTTFMSEEQKRNFEQAIKNEP